MQLRRQSLPTASKSLAIKASYCNFYMLFYFAVIIEHMFYSSLLISSPSSSFSIHVRVIDLYSRIRSKISWYVWIYCSDYFDHTRRSGLDTRRIRAIQIWWREISLAVHFFEYILHLSGNISSIKVVVDVGGVTVRVSDLVHPVAFRVWNTITIVK